MERCDHCRKPIRDAQPLRGPGGLRFDSRRCRERYLAAAQLRGFQNAVRVARSRLKRDVIERAGRVYRQLGGRDWYRVQQLLKAVL